MSSEMPDCMRDKYTIVQSIIDLIVFLIVVIGQVIQAIYLSIVGHPKRDLRGGIVVVTGGGGGLGSLIALRLARLGCTIVLWDINKQGECYFIILITNVYVYIIMERECDYYQ